MRIVKMKNEHLEQIILAITKFGIPKGADHFSSTEELEGYMDKHDFQGIVALKPDSNKIVGFILYGMGYLESLEPFKRRFRKNTEIGYISDIIVFPSFQGKGVGSRLVKAAEVNLVKMGARKTTLIVSDSNQRAQAFFKKNRYAISEQTDVVGFEKDLKWKKEAFWFKS